ncbi:hypothetical protein [Paraburkholderia phenoliruptrix]|uniref:hypothetical protein n=1 Tax=Paraburkholderia phenoliruptrix TaxID=252970 RepID=UPI001C6E919F|nr:hypothetical protein [Paraburkholderia phenoliruptrix]MBW9102931.1 hypothetical protein [Paraburkholderia phenoliruptrix]MBW9132905.1 hypothetical protein [Paraburkholderia ginsengiterrae]
MRTITEHATNPANDRLVIEVIDEPGSGGANHKYMVSGYRGESGHDSVLIEFQNGPINEVGVNGLTHEVLLAIVIDRLRAFQDGPYACEENSFALLLAEQSLHWMQLRTAKRMQRGVEGTHAV